ncbi:MAG: hypothetical protein PHG66_04610 [Candidatus Colwellbacteria bacterium]|nr:hypothetical protein [Candidatus Colwellbacteria bacterium]
MSKPKQVEIIFESDDESLGDVSKIILSDGSDSDDGSDEDSDGKTWYLLFHII